MSIVITVQGTPIIFPTSGDPANWAQGLADFAQAVEGALQSAVGNFDVPPQVVNIDAYNGATDIDITPLSFPTSDVQAVSIFYSTHRTTTLDNTAESGTINLTYNPSTNIWDITREINGGKYLDANNDMYITFAVTSAGQVTFSTNTMTGSSHTGIISIYAKAILQQN